jgi:hypothetical protein
MKAKLKRSNKDIVDIFISSFLGIFCFISFNAISIPLGLFLFTSAYLTYKNPTKLTVYLRKDYSLQNYLYKVTFNDQIKYYAACSDDHLKLLLELDGIENYSFEKIEKLNE